MSAPPRTEPPVIICHDGSSEATAALEYAATPLPRARAVIVRLRWPLAEESPAPAGPPVTERRREAEERLCVQRPVAAQLR